MLIDMESIHAWAGKNLFQRRYIEAERILTAKHVLKCGKIVDSRRRDVVTIKAECIKTSDVRNKHQINVNIDEEGKIVACTCSCKAGQGEKSKHTVAVLLYIHRYLLNLKY